MGFVFQALRQTRRPLLAAAAGLLPYGGLAITFGFVTAFLAAGGGWQRDYTVRSPVPFLAAAIALVVLTGILLPRIALRLPPRLDANPHELEAYFAAQFLVALILPLVVPVLGFMGAFLAGDPLFYLAATLLGLVPAILAWPTRGRRMRWERVLGRRGILETPSVDE
jgi:hypothetical protein